ncbi:MAG: sigma-70 family RNA polymerase sigma factor [Verrucomicrobiota bacterium]|jgi:RNA polymerase sigma-70 factor, ECF subfamily
MTPADSDAQDRSDMGRLSSGDDAALNALMDRHGERLFHYLLRQLNNESDAADLAQESFVRVYQNRTRFDPAHKFSTWLYTIATNLLRDRFRWRQRHPQVSLDAEREEAGAILDTLPDTAATPAEQIVTEERAVEVRKAIESLPDDLRSPLLLSEYEGLSHAEIGAVLSCSTKAVETRLYRARNHLRKRLETLISS